MVARYWKKARRQGHFGDHPWIFLRGYLTIEKNGAIHCPGPANADDSFRLTAPQLRLE